MVFAVIILNDHKGISFNKKIKDKRKFVMEISLIKEMRGGTMYDREKIKD